MNIALIGYGKMGQMIDRVAQQRGHKVVCVIDVHNQEDFDSAAFRSADVAIEFTTPWSAYDNIMRCFDRDIKVVTGSTGWQAEHQGEIEELCQYGLKTLFWSSNFSLGVYLFNKLNEQLARLMATESLYSPKMYEIHHVHKLDAPSGTAITLAENLIRNYPNKSSWKMGTLLKPDGSKEGSEEAEGCELVINAIREGEVPGTHVIDYDSEFDRIEIKHEAHSRGGFVLGAVRAAEFTKDHSGLLTMDDLFNSK